MQATGEIPPHVRARAGGAPHTKPQPCVRTPAPCIQCSNFAHRRRGLCRPRRPLRSRSSRPPSASLYLWRWRRLQLFRAGGSHPFAAAIRREAASAHGQKSRCAARQHCRDQGLHAWLWGRVGAAPECPALVHAGCAARSRAPSSLLAPSTQHTLASPRSFLAPPVRSGTSPSSPGVSSPPRPPLKKPSSPSPPTSTPALGLGLAAGLAAGLASAGLVGCMGGRGWV